MKSFLAAVIVATTIAIASSAPVSAVERAPSYLILRAPTGTHKSRPHYPGRGYEVRTQAYAYGWFGARPTRHHRRSTGYNESYIRWSKR